ncbi:pyridoxamine 5'-phosphate oxidase [Streptomyces vietnamensis]|uniref:Pyridoxine/pyridoxamine 5'-phosphate oxidase n=2 Tax=Streptomyces vietnamensis TaxID=362257 RepID=A0A0B5HXF3_9ACTN|nr:pyridoxamine 5'-phosphate oxidase [Streptomyces vietnamensis]
MTDALDPADMREQYRTTELTVADLAPEPVGQFARWFKETAENPAIHEPNAMIVSTATPEGRPSSRTVLLKHYDEAGFVFFTNYESRKGKELAANPYASLLFPWHPLARQVIVTGRAVHVGRDETVAYFRTRPHGSQLGAWASPQSQVIDSRAELLARYDELAARYPEPEQVPVPPSWGGIRVVPETVEFWQGHENRLHDRLRYVHETDGTWRVERLAP